ncbi:MAG: S24 family peptidase [Bacteroidales bacterium]|nr:S24 family peptidase [Bacteroidales bacterium]
MSEEFRSMTSTEAEESGITLTPFYDELPVTAGQTETPGYNEHSTGLYIPGVRAEAFFPVMGHSMEPYIYPGDIVGVRTVNSFDGINPDATYMVVTRSNERMIKHIVPPTADDDSITLTSDNPAYPPFRILRNDVVRVMKVVYSGRTYK